MEIMHVHIFRPGGKPDRYRPVSGGTVFAAVLRGELEVAADLQRIAVEAAHVLIVPSAGLTSVVDSRQGCLGVCWSVAGAWVSAARVPQPMDEVMALVLDDVLGTGAGPDTPLVLTGLAYLSSRLGRQAIDSIQPQKDMDLASQVCHYMEANLDGHLDLADLCAQFGCSRTLLSRAFRAAGLPSPMQHVAALRIRSASESLRQSDLSISNIATSVGFRDLPSFSRFFRGHTGYAPREYRRNCRWLL
jgi:AraC-like DNA-binding protein